MKNFLLSCKQKKKENSERIYKRISNIMFLEAEETFIRNEEMKEESAFENRLQKYIEEVEDEIKKRDE